jgi:C4-dicarboxylate transporter
MTKFASRKFITAAFTIMSMLSAIALGSLDAPTGFAGILTVAMGYIVVEGHIDAKRAAQVARVAAAVAETAATALEKAADVIDTTAKSADPADPSFPPA